MVLAGSRPLLDSCVATIVLARVGRPPALEEWFKKIGVIPVYIIFMPSSDYCYYRLHACHEYWNIPMSQEPENSLLNLHVGIGKYDLFCSLLTEQATWISHFYEYYPVVCRFSQAVDGDVPPRGGLWHKIADTIYLRLFHHTTVEGKEGILRDNFLRPSYRNFCGNRLLSVGYCYMTDVPDVKSLYNTLPLLIKKPGSNLLFRTDDELNVVECPIDVEDRELGEKVAFLVSLNLIQPNPMIFHHPIRGQPKWLENEFTNIYRIPCEGLTLNENLEIDGEIYWIVNKDNAIGYRTDDPITFASGNDIKALLGLMNEVLTD